MSGTVMKFGPQWIRTLTDGAAPSSTPNSNNNSTQNNNNNSTTSTSSTSSSLAAVNNYHNNNPSLYSNSSSNNGNTSSNTGLSSAGKYKLAEYRYGREEMLALFEPNMEAPDDIKNFTGLYVEKARMPMAMTQMSEEEVKLSTRTWNSDQVLRSVGKAAAAATGGGAVGVGSGANHIGGISGVGGGLGGHTSLGSTMNDRDSKQMSERGAMTAAEVLSSSPRGPPGAMSRVPLGEQRGLLSSIGSRAPPSTIRSLVGRGANLYMRSQSHDDEGVGSGDGLGTGSSSAGVSGSSGPTAFEGRFGLSGQPRQPSSLRARFENSRAPGIGAGPVLANSSKLIDIKSGIDTELPPQGRSVFDRLPSKHNADDKLIRKDINGRPMPNDWRSRDWSASSGQEVARTAPKGIGLPDEGRSWRSTRTGGAQNAEDWRSGSGHTAGSGTAGSQSSWYVRTDDQRNLRQHLPQNQENLNPSSSGKRDTLRRPSVDDKHGDEDGDIINQPRHRRDSLPEWSIGDLSGDKVGSFDATGNFRSEPRDDGGNLLNNKMKAPEKQHQRQQQQHNHQQQQLNQSKKQQDHQREQLQTNDFEHMERAAEIMVEKWTAEEDQHEHKSSISPEFLRNKSNSNSREQHDAQHANILQNNSIDNRKSGQVHHHRQEQHQSGSDSSVGGSGATGNAFDSANNQQKLILLPSNHEDAQQWFYRDTQSVIQGPFSANDMFEWYKAGYFVKELLVRRACDELFYPLGDVIKMWNGIPFAPIPVDMAPPPPITSQMILQFRAMQKQIQMAAASEARIPPNAFDVPPGTVLLPGQLLQQQQSIHPVLAAASMNQNAMAPPDQQANIRQIIEAATRQQQQRQQEHHEPAILQQQRNMPVNGPDTNEMQAQLRQLLVQLKNRDGFLNLNAQQQQEVLVRQFVATRTTMGQSSVASGNSNALQEQEHQALLQQQHRAGLIPFMPSFLSNDQQERLRYQQELERRQKEEAEKQQQQNRLIMEQRMEVEKEKQRLMEEVQKQRQKKQLEESEKQKQEAEEDRIRKLNMLKQQQLAKQHEEFKQQLQIQQRIQMEQQQKKQHHQQQQQQQAQQQQQQQPAQQPQATPLSTIQQQQQQQIERAKKAAQAHQVQQEQQQQQQQRKTAWSVSKPEVEPVSLATLQKQQEEEKEKERERQRQQQAQMNQQQQQQQQQINFQRQMTWANAAQQPKPAPVKTLAEIQKEEEERLTREKQRKAKVQPVVASAGVWNNAASHLSWKNPPSDS